MYDLLDWLHEHGLALAVLVCLAFGAAGHLVAWLAANETAARACLWAAGFGAGVVVGAVIASVQWQAVVDGQQRQLRRWYDRRRP